MDEEITTNRETRTAPTRPNSAAIVSAAIRAERPTASIGLT